MFPGPLPLRSEKVSEAELDEIVAVLLINTVGLGVWKVILQ